MATVTDIHEHLAQLLSEKLSLDDFEDWFVPYSWNIHKHGDEESQRFAYAIERELARFEEDSNELRQRLADLFVAFAVSFGMNQFGNPIPLSVAESSSEPGFTPAAA